MLQPVCLRMHHKCLKLHLQWVCILNQKTGRGVSLRVELCNRAPAVETACKQGCDKLPTSIDQYALRNQLRDVSCNLRSPISRSRPKFEANKIVPFTISMYLHPRYIDRSRADTHMHSTQQKEICMRAAYIESVGLPQYSLYCLYLSTAVNNTAIVIRNLQ